jgi:asparagine synthase (glutamine-hydrolysing)
VLELGLSLPIEAKVTRWQSKRLLRRLLRPRLPRAAGRDKRGFEPPVDAWFRGPAASRLRGQLVDGGLVTRLGFSRPAVAGLVERHRRGEDLGRQLFALLVLEIWAGQHA